MAAVRRWREGQDAACSNVPALRATASCYPGRVFSVESSSVLLHRRYARRSRMVDDDLEEFDAAPETPKREWPEHFPRGCPPTDALDLEHRVYYLVATSVPTAKDMECAIERNTHVGRPECLRASLSCGLDAAHVEEMRKYPRLKRHLLAYADLKPEHGKIKQTGAPGHHSMWLRAVVLPTAHTLSSALTS